MAAAPSRWWRLSLLITLAAGALRIGYVLAVTQHQELPAPERAAVVRSFDERWYQEVAINLAEGDGFRLVELGGWEGETARHPPGAAVALVPAALLSTDDLPMRLTVALAGTVVVLLTALLARRLAGDLAGLIAGGVAAVHPYLWLNDGLVMSETFSSLAALVAVLATVAAIRRPSAWRALGVGAAVGAGALTRGELLLLGPALVVAILLAGHVPLTRRLGMSAVAGLAAVAVLAPWAVHNLDRFEETVLLSTNDGDTLVGANCDETYAGDLIGFHYGYCGVLGESAGDESIDAVMRREVALDHIAANVERVPLVVAARLGRVVGAFQPFWLAEAAQDEGRPRTAALAGWAVGLALVPAAVGGVVVLRRRGRSVAPVLAPIATVLVGTALTYGHPRFRAPAEPALVALAAVGLAAWWSARSTPAEPTVDQRRSSSSARTSPNPVRPASGRRTSIGSRRSSTYPSA